MITRDEFIAAYVKRARAAGFQIDSTGDGCVYHEDQPDDGDPRCVMVARPCDCGCVEGWGMFDA